MDIEHRHSWQEDRDDLHGTSFLSVSSLIIVFPRQYLTDSCLVDLIYVTLACEDTNSKLVDIVTANVDDRIVLATVCCRFGS